MYSSTDHEHVELPPIGNAPPQKEPVPGAILLARALMVAGCLGVPAYFLGYYVLVLLCGAAELISHIVISFYSGRVSTIMLSIIMVSGVLWANVRGYSVFLGVPLAFCWDAVAMVVIAVLDLLSGHLPALRPGRVALVLSVLVAVAGCASAVYCYSLYLGAQGELNLAQDSVASLEEDKRRQQETIDQLSGDIDQLQADNADLQSALSDALSRPPVTSVTTVYPDDYDLLARKAAYLDDSMAIMAVQSNAVFYHKLGCPALGNGSTYYCTIDEAEESGIWPCPQCH